MKIRNVRSDKLFISLLIFVLGLITGLLVNDIPYLSFRTDLSIGELSNLLLALVAAFYIPFYLSSEIDDKRVEKDIIIEMCNKNEAMIKEIIDLVNLEVINSKSLKNDKATTIILKVRFLAQNLTQLTEVIKKYKKTPGIENVCSNLNKTYRDFWGVLTVDLRNNPAEITMKSLHQAHQHFSNYNKNLISLRLLLNRT